MQALDVPHLVTALGGPLLELERTFLRAQSRIEAWFRRQWRDTPPPFYCSVDLRNAGFKLAPVDTNLFPAGFNNLNPAFLPLCIQAVQAAVERVCPAAEGVLVVPERHTRNLPYFASLARLTGILETAGFTVRLGDLPPFATEGPREVMLADGRTLTIGQARREGDRIRVDDFSPCLVLLNNDLSAGRPPLLEGIAQNVAPPLALGWSERLKSAHFTHYHAVAEEFAGFLGIDPWLVEPLFRNCGQIDFMKREGEDCLAHNVEVLFNQIRQRYREHGIDREPFVIVKADAGTYGMAVMTVRAAEEVQGLGRKQRTRMSYAKEGRAVSDVILQEGVYTFETHGAESAVAEPVVYMIDRFVVGGFYRVHAARGDDENLNAPGATFEPLSFMEPCNTPDASCAPDCCANRFYAYGVVARLALVAAAREVAASRTP